MRNSLPAFTAIAAIVPFLLGALIMPAYLQLLKKMQIQQYLREEGPKSHAHKEKTPTAGGVVFIFGAILGWTVYSVSTVTAYSTMRLAAPLASSVLSFAVAWLSLNLPISLLAGWLILISAIACGSLGLADDLAKVRQQSNKGVSESLRLKIEALIGFLLAFGLLVAHCPIQVFWPDFSAAPCHFSMQLYSMSPVLAVPLSIFLLMATTNSVNLHDGMDGLAAGTSFLVLCAMSLMLVWTNQLPLAVLAAIGASAVLAFLLYNRNPARVFMGDTGSLFIGGLTAGLAFAGGLLIPFIPLTLIYILEVLSVIAQVVYFKLTKPYTPEKPVSQIELIKLKLTRRLPGEGKRLFRMAPLHHHFEAVLAAKGVRENQIVAAFWLAQALICAGVLIAFSALKL